MIPGMEYIAAFVAGIICMPFIIEAYGYLREWQLERKYTECMDRMKNTHNLNMNKLVKKYNDAAEGHNKHLSKVKRKLAKRNLKVKVDEDGNEILVKQVPVRIPFKDLLKQ